MKHKRPPTATLVNFIGMALTTMCGSAFVVGGILAGVRGLTAISLAAVVPLAGLLWAIMITTIEREQRNRSQHPPPGHNDDPVGYLVGPVQNRW